MPLVEYRCADCQYVFERLVPQTEGADRGECPSCGQLTGQRLLSLIAQTHPVDGASAASGGCCGAGGCACGH